MISYPKYIEFSIMGELGLIEEEIQSGSAQDQAKLINYRDRLLKYRDQFISAAERLRILPEAIYKRSHLQMLSDKHFKIKVYPATAAQLISLLELISPHPIGHTSSGMVEPYYPGETNSYRIFPYSFTIRRSQSPTCALDWQFGHNDDDMIKIRAYLPRQWTRTIFGTASGFAENLLIQDLVPYERHGDTKDEVYLRFPKAYDHKTGLLLTWRDIPILRKMETAGELDPCIGAKFNEQLDTAITFSSTMPQ